MDHCVETVCRIIAQNLSDRRSLFQLGYNLGRLSELTGLGREPFWDRWKTAVTEWDRETLLRLAHELPLVVVAQNSPPDSPIGTPSDEPR
jgi:hypothetical protein